MSEENGKNLDKILEEFLNALSKKEKTQLTEKDIQEILGASMPLPGLSPMLINPSMFVATFLKAMTQVLDPLQIEGMFSLLARLLYSSACSVEDVLPYAEWFQQLDADLMSIVRKDL